MSQNLNRTPIMAAALAVAAHSGLGLSAEVIPPRPALGDWMSGNNRRRRPKVKRVTSQLNVRLKRAIGPGSYDEWKHELAAKRAAKRSA